ncbi:MAG: bifunctional phosphoribosylaminoimidazolecarboxamide formyltransferase/IMP cyclohydrolase [Deltaproteobacteria bacterium]|nr:bifunctional phosphoribosylaminoimidazolecarboxamide formyltransferase/IMP cyclohydrolase [Deltaproteobacteria bacterium]
MVRRALISVSDKTGLVELGQALHALGVELLASGKTAEALRTAHCPVTELAAWTGMPELLDGRVKTLHPKIHAGILARRDLPAHVADLQQAGFAPIDLVVVNLYPFEQTVAQPNVTLADAIEQIDIGGPTLLRAAAKNYAHVVALCDPADYAECLAQLKAGDGNVPEAYALQCARAVFARIAAYDAAINNYLAERDATDPFPAQWSAHYTKVQAMRYGENPHQAAAWYQTAGESLNIAAALQGKALSYNNLLDTDAAIHLAGELRSYPFAAVIIKHGNPCGVGVSERSLAEAFGMALEADPLAAFGGIVVTTTELDDATARVVSERFFEVICAPSFAANARTLLAAKPNLRLVPCLWPRPEPWSLRSACGGLLVQTSDVREEVARDWRVVTKRAPTPEEERALALAWRVCKYVRSNAVVFATGAASVGIGAGQMSRVDAVRVATMKAAGRPAVAAASDAFFPFRDGVDAIAEARVRAVIHPGGSVRDAEVIAAADEHGMAMVVTGTRHFRH